MQMRNIHIGSLIKEQFEKKMESDKHFNKTVFANMIHVHRSTIYPMFEHKSIDIDLLMRISEALGYDFIKEVYSEKQDENECKPIIEVEVSKRQLQQLESSDNFFVVLKINKE